MQFSKTLPTVAFGSQRGLCARALRCAAAALLVVYLGWNAYWLVQARLPPSLLKGLTGLPCPTTGGTRSIQALCRGEVAESLRYNPMTLPLVGLFCVSAIWPMALWMRGRRPSIPSWIGVGWVAVLGIAWLAKLLGDPQYW